MSRQGREGSALARVLGRPNLPAERENCRRSRSTPGARGSGDGGDLGQAPDCPGLQIGVLTEHHHPLTRQCKQSKQVQGAFRGHLSVRSRGYPSEFSDVSDCMSGSEFLTGNMTGPYNSPTLQPSLGRLGRIRSQYGRNHWSTIL